MRHFFIIHYFHFSLKFVGKTFKNWETTYNIHCDNCFNHHLQALFQFWITKKQNKVWLKGNIWKMFIKKTNFSFWTFGYQWLMTVFALRVVHVIFIYPMKILSTIDAAWTITNWRKKRRQKNFSLKKKTMRRLASSREIIRQQDVINQSRHVARGSVGRGRGLCPPKLSQALPKLY